MEEREQIEIIKKYQGFVRNNGSDTLMLVRYGAYGDHLFMSGVFPFLFEKYDRVLLEVNPKGIELFQHDNRFDFIGLYEPWNIPEKKRLRVVSEHWQTLLDRFPDYDFLNFWGSMEGSGIVHEDSPEALLSPSARKERFHINFHERHFQMAEMEVPDGWMATPEVFYPNEWEEWAQSWKKKDKDYFHMLIPIAGSTLQKVFPTWLPSFCRHLIDKYEDLKIYLFGDHECDGEDWDYERTISWTHRRGRERMSFAQVLLMAKYADYVLGPETGLLAGAGMWGTPKTYLCTAADRDQLARYHRNDYSVQSLAPCSPCYRTCYTGRLCEKEMFFDSFPRCTVNWDWDELLSIFEDVYGRRS